MKRLLPVLFFIFFSFLLFFSPVKKTYAQTVSASDSVWQKDEEVTFVGKMAARANDFINLSLKDYKWVDDSVPNPLISFWVTLRNIIYALLILFILAAAFLMIISRGRSLTLMQFIPRFVFVILGITFSFALIQFLFQITDIIQGFFLKTPSGEPITASNLLSVAFNYSNFVGYKRSGMDYQESAFISLLLIKMTTFTYFIMGGILMVRKIILWFFVIISPLFPILLFYPSIRNTARRWFSEFTRWLLYAPFFAVLLSGLVSLWESSSAIPLKFNFNSPESYPTAINILLGGPGQVVSITNSLNNPDTFTQYLIALLMLWVVMLLPFLLLHLILDYLFTLSMNNYPKIKQFLGNTSLLTNKIIGAPVSPQSPAPSSYAPSGAAKALPFSRNYSYTKNFQMPNIKSGQNTSEILRLSNLSVPTMRDIARYETNLISRDIEKKSEITRMHDSLTKIANPTLISSSLEREKYTSIRTQLTSEKLKGNPVASNILSAASLASSSVSTRTSTAANTSTNISSAQRPLQQVVSSAPLTLPVVNNVQTVSLDDYESIKNLWQDNYRNLDVPKAVGEEEKTRKDWIKSDMDKINETINLLSSGDPEQAKKGMENVSRILPFLLIGGFSKTEVIAYLKAKLEAAKAVKTELDKVLEEEKPKEMAAEAELT